MPVYEPPRKGTSPWVWVSVGCGVVVLLLIAVFTAGAFFAFNAARTAVQQPVPTLTAPAMAKPTSSSQAKVKVVWKLDIGAPATCLAAEDLLGEGKPQVLACDENGVVHVVGLDGKEKRTMPVGQGARRFSVCDLTGDGRIEVVAMQQWGSNVEAFDSKGKSLWRYAPRNFGVDSVVSRDFNGDGKAETAIGYNGFTGLHLVSSTGRRLWTYKRIGNVWNVAAGRVMGDGKVYVLATDAGGSVTILDANSSRVAVLRAGSAYLSHVYSSDLDSDGTDEVLAVGSSYGSSKEIIMCMDKAGAIKWQVVTGPEDNDTGRQIVSTGDLNADGHQDVVALGADGTFTIVAASGTVRLKHSVGVALNGVCALPACEAGKQRFVVGAGTECVCYEETGK